MSFALVADSRTWPAGIYFGLYLCVFIYKLLYNRPLWAYPIQLDKLRETLTVIDTVFLFNALEQYMAAVSTSCKAKCKPRGKSWVSEKQKCIHIPYAFDAAPCFFFFLILPLYPLANLKNGKTVIYCMCSYLSWDLVIPPAVSGWWHDSALMLCEINHYFATF